jgi:hypothetical protein
MGTATLHAEDRSLQHEPEDTTAPREKKSLKSILLSPTVVGIEFAVVVLSVVTFGFITNPPEPPYTGTATVVSYETANKRCYLTLRHADDGKKHQHRPLRQTCERLHEGMTVRLVEGKIQF